MKTLYIADKICVAKRIAIVGWPGAGKSTFAKKLGDKLNREVFSIDKIRFDKTGKKVQDSEYDKSHKKLLSRKTWIIEGNEANRLIDKRLNTADLILFLDSNRLLSLSNCLSRIFKIKIGSEKRQGVHSRNSLNNVINQSRHILTVAPKSMAKIKALLKNHQAKTYFIKSRKQANEIVRNLEEK